MPSRSRVTQLQRSIIISSVLGILVVGVIVGLASMAPLYRHLMRTQEDHLMWILATKRVAIEDVLSKSSGVGTKIAALPEIAEKLDNYTKAIIGRQDLTEFTQNAFSNMANVLPMVAGVAIFDEQGRLVAHVGTKSPNLLPQAEADSATIFFGSTESGETRHFAVAIPIYSKAGRKIGSTVVTFQISELEKALQNHGGLGRTGEAILYALEHDRVTPILRSRQNRGDGSQKSRMESGVELPIPIHALKQTGMLIPGKDYEGPEVIAYTAIGGGQWGVAVKMDKGELYAPVFPHIMTTGGIISALILLGTLGTLLLVRPLAGKLVIHADELEQQIREKTKVIEDLYEHIVQSEKSKALTEHTAEVAHELRQPLTIVGGFARRMAKHFDAGGAFGKEQEESCRIILSEIQRLEKILDGLIDFTRSRNLCLAKAVPNNVIQSVVKLYGAKFREKALMLEAALSENIGEIVLDADRFEQVVRNLVSNAIEASPAGETIRIQTRVNVPSTKARQTGQLESESYFEMTIHNCGPEISPELLQRIFSPFFTTKDSGKGLGLTITKKIVEDHKGSISIISNDQGTLFTVLLPIKREISAGRQETCR